MLPILYQNEWFLIPSWHAAYALGSLIAFLIFLKLSDRHESIHGGKVRGLLIGTYLAGYVGARAFSLWIEEDKAPWAASFWSSLLEPGAMTLYGGVLLAIAVGVALARGLRLPVPSLLDFGVASAGFAIAIGRIGCFLNGDDYGKVVTEQDPALAPWWAVRFPNHEEPLFRHPVQLYESGFCFLLGVLLLLVLVRVRRRWGPGALAAFGGLAYAFARFGLEFLRGDERGFLLSAALSPAQWVSLGILALGAAFLFQRIRTRWQWRSF